MIDPELKPYLAMWSAAWSELPADATVQDRRDMLMRLTERAAVPLPPGIASSELWIDGPRRVRVRVYRPDGGVVTPCLIYMHGGGWMQGSPETHQEIAAAIASKNRQTVISVDYALAPEHPFPAAVEDCEAVVRFAFSDAAALRIDPRRIAIGGDSAGANLAAAMTLVFRGTRQKLAGQLLFYPPVDFDFTRPAYVENAAGPIITTASMDGPRRLYLTRPEDRTNPLAAPYLAGDHSGLPPAFIAVAEHDPLRDDGHDYARKLRGAGVPVTVHDGKGLFHGYLRAMSMAGIVRRAFGEAAAWLARINGG
jgi:acetyl esterase